MRILLSLSACHLHKVASAAISVPLPYMEPFVVERCLDSSDRTVETGGCLLGQVARPVSSGGGRIWFVQERGDVFLHSSCVPVGHQAPSAAVHAGPASPALPPLLKPIPHDVSMPPMSGGHPCTHVNPELPLLLL